MSIRDSKNDPTADVLLTEAEVGALVYGWGNFMDDYLDTVKAITAIRVAQARTTWDLERSLTDPSRWGFIDPHGRQAALIREAVADAWDEGHGATDMHGPNDCLCSNPHRP